MAGADQSGIMTRAQAIEYDQAKVLAPEVSVNPAGGIKKRQLPKWDNKEIAF